jgi:hypothetical protein
MTRLINQVQDQADGIYGWCGLCHSFVDFPHDCAGADQPVRDDDEIA